MGSAYDSTAQYGEAESELRLLAFTGRNGDDVGESSAYQYRVLSRSTVAVAADEE